MKILTLLLILFSSLAAQTGEIFYKADSLYNNENFFDAVTEYKRLLFFDANEKYSYEANFKIGLSYKAGGYFDNAIEFLAKALKNAKTEEKRYPAFVEIIRCNILRKTTDNALTLLKNAIENGEYLSRKNEIYYWMGWAEMFADRWNEASAAFSRIEVEHPLKKFASQVHNKKYDVTFAKLISYILPGSGQFYSGEYLSGVMSLGWTVLWGYVTVDAFASERVFDGFMVGNLLWFRFYRGNYENAEKFALEKNNKIYIDALLYLQNNFEGIKP